MGRCGATAEAHSKVARRRCATSDNGCSGASSDFTYYRDVAGTISLPTLNNGSLIQNHYVWGRFVDGFEHKKNVSMTGYDTTNAKIDAELMRGAIHDALMTWPNN